MILKSNNATSSHLIEHISEVYKWRIKCDRVNSENTQQRKLDRQNLISTSDLNRNSHREFLIFVLG